MPQKIDVEEGNKTIAEFMQHPFVVKFKKLHPESEFQWELLKYHSSWDWLIPAMAKAKEVIKKAGWGTPTEKQAWSRLNAALNETFNLNIENAHYCFVKFIQWYNQNNPQ